MTQLPQAKRKPTMEKDENLLTQMSKNFSALTPAELTARVENLQRTRMNLSKARRKVKGEVAPKTVKKEKKKSIPLNEIEL